MNTEQDDYLKELNIKWDEYKKSVDGLNSQIYKLAGERDDILRDMASTRQNAMVLGYNFSVIQMKWIKLE